MRKTGFALLAGLFVLSIAAGGCATTPAGKTDGTGEPPSWQTATVVEEKATVEAIDQSTRMVTLKGSKGNSVTFKASDEVKNLAQVKVGDDGEIRLLRIHRRPRSERGRALSTDGREHGNGPRETGGEAGGSRREGDDRQRHDHGHRQEGEDRDPEGGGREVRHGDTEAPGETRRGQGGGPPGDHVHGSGRGLPGEGGKKK